MANGNVQNKGIVEYPRIHSGIPDFEFSKVWMVFDTLFVCCSTMKEWPAWVNATIFDQIRRLYDESSRLNYHTDVICRLRGRPPLRHIISRFEAKARGTLGDKPKLHAYSAQDTTLAAMLAAVGIYPKQFPDYSSAVMLVV
ncbi:unnamed protein product [Heligmosomoides polygyrus]|uniref:DSPn domain-containing protein n=1 Tax=Heligmosomoides polygyrus TaxID=6339 RepID=A0A183G4F6_HELPZ|nr:unnamed protein product [Heligmosomoides polygyrus]